MPSGVRELALSLISSRAIVYFLYRPKFKFSIEGIINLYVENTSRKPYSVIDRKQRRNFDPLLTGKERVTQYSRGNKTEESEEMQ